MKLLQLNGWKYSFHNFSSEVNHFYSVWKWVAALSWQMSCLWCRRNQIKTSHQNTVRLWRFAPWHASSKLSIFSQSTRNSELKIKMLMIWYPNLLEVSRLASFCSCKIPMTKYDISFFWDTQICLNVGM